MISKKQYPAMVYLYWCLDNFFHKRLDSYIRVDFRESKKALESFVLVLDDDGLYFSMEGNHFSDFGHDSYSKDYGLIRRDKEDNWLNEFHQRFDHWFSVVSKLLDKKGQFIRIEYYGEFKRDINYGGNSFES